MIKRTVLVSAIFSASLMQGCIPTCIQQGPNRLQPAPVLANASKNPITFVITVNGSLSTIRRKATYIIQFFGNPENRNPITEGADLLGQITVTTDCNGVATFRALLPPTQNTDPFLSATATLVQCDGTLSDTSEFSANVAIS